MFDEKNDVKVCPFLTKQIIIKNSITDSRVFDFGINSIRDNDLIFSDFLPCLGDKCMAWDTIRQGCKRLK